MVGWTGRLGGVSHAAGKLGLVRGWLTLWEGDLREIAHGWRGQLLAFLDLIR